MCIYIYTRTYTHAYIQYNMDGRRCLNMMSKNNMLFVRPGAPNVCSPLPEPCQESNKGKNKKALNSTDPGMQGLAFAEGSDSLWGWHTLCLKTDGDIWYVHATLRLYKLYVLIGYLHTTCDWFSTNMYIYGQYTIDCLVRYHEGINRIWSVYHLELEIGTMVGSWLQSCKRGVGALFSKHSKPLMTASECF